MEDATIQYWISEQAWDDQEDVFMMNQYNSQTLLSPSSEGLIFYPSAAYNTNAKNSTESRRGGFEEGDCSPLLLSFRHPVQSRADPGKGDIGGKKKKKAKKMEMGVVEYGVDEHIAAERRRREKLSQRFIALAAIIPGLKKMDKATILGDTIKHIKEMEERAKLLENKIALKTVDVVNANSGPDNSKDCESLRSTVSSLKNSNNGGEQKVNMLQIEVKMREKGVLVKVRSGNLKGVLAAVISAIEELPAMVNNFGAVSFMDGCLLDITITAQVEENCSITVEDVAKKLNSALSQFN